MFNRIHHDIGELVRTTSHTGSRVYRTPTGNTYPSVTSITSLLKKDLIQEWRNSVGHEQAQAITTRAANRGTRVHKLCEDYLSNIEPEVDMFDQEMWKDLKPQLSHIQNIHALETPLYSDHLQIAGTVDCIAEWDDKLSVIDFKTSRRPKKKEWIDDYFMQCSAYAVAFEERTGIPVGRIVIVMAVEDDEPIIFHEKRDNWVNKFIEVRENYRKLKGV
jgi:genome maintenance exonuclease 1